MIRISVYDIVGPTSATCLDGSKVCERLYKALKEKLNVTLSFKDVDLISLEFLDVAIGQLYGVFSEEEIRSLLHVEDMQQDDLELLKRVVENAKTYFKNLMSEEE